MISVRCCYGHFEMNSLYLQEIKPSDSNVIPKIRSNYDLLVKNESLLK